MPPVVHVDRGTIWWCDFSPARGREQNGRRSALIVSVDRFNHGRSERVVVCPMTSQEARMPLHVVVPAAMTGDVDLTVLCEQVRTISVERLDGRPYSRVDAATMAQVEQRLRVLLGL